MARGGGFVDTRIIWGFLSLDKKYPKEVVNNAAGIALEIINDLPLEKLPSRFLEKQRRNARLAFKSSDALHTPALAAGFSGKR